MKTNTLSLLAGCLLFTQAAFGAENWPQFRGPNCSGVSDTAKPPIEFGPGKNQLWKVAAPGGASSPCVWGDRIFLTAFDGGKLKTLCYQGSDGKLLWERVAPADKLEEFNASEGSPAASTPVTDGKFVVSFFGSCGLICHDFAGKEIWRHKLPVAETAGSFGTGSSPALAGGLVIVNRDQAKDCTLLAVDLQSGSKVWEAKRPDVTQSYGSPMVWKNGSTEEIVMSGSLKLKGYEVKTGKELWSLPGMPSFTCTTPVAGDGMLFFAGWAPGKADSPMPPFASLLEQMDKNKDKAITLDEAKGTWLEAFFQAQDMDHDGKITQADADAMKAMMSKGENIMIALKAGGKGELAETQLAWKQAKGLPYVPSPLYYQGRVYLIKDGGMISSFEAKTGKVFYQQERLDAIGNYYASPVAADGRIYVASMNGKMTVLKAGGEKPEILHQAEFGERISATPALVEKTLYLRTPTALYAFGK
jgi:outer membrane protein assembly factor BamB